MGQTNVASGSPQSALVYGAALFAQVQKKTGTFRNMVGPKPTGAEVDAKLSKQQSDPGMPIVEINDLTKTAGDSARLDCIDVVTAKPIMGDKNAEGKGSGMSFSNSDIMIDQWTFPVNAGGRMSQQRTAHDLRKLARAQAVGLASRYFEQRTLVHLAGARGSANGTDWVVPLTSDADFEDIMINPVKAPTYNRHFTVDGDLIVQGGANIANLGDTDELTLAHIDQLRNVIDNLDLSLQPVKIADDPAADDEPMWVLLLPPNVYSQLLDTSSSGIRAFQQNAINRASFGSKHPLFRGEVGMWNGILVKKMSRVIRFNGGDTAKHITSANAATATETDVTVPTVAGFSLERGLLLGAQALGIAYGKDAKSGTHYSWAEKMHNFEREPEFAVFGVEGSAKVRFNVPDGNGGKTPTDHGVMVLDVMARQSVA